MKPRKIYVASSWRNPYYPTILKALQIAGHDCYDFRNPAPGNTGFAWSQLDPEWENWTMKGYVEKLTTSPVSAAGFKLDKDALDWCDTCVLVLPCGRSAHLEAGYAIGQGKPTFFLLHEDKFEPELMYLLGDGFAVTISELLNLLENANANS